MDGTEERRPGASDGLPPLVKGMIALVALILLFVVVIDLIGFIGYF